MNLVVGVWEGGVWGGVWLPKPGACACDKCIASNGIHTRCVVVAAPRQLAADGALFAVEALVA